MSTPLETLRLAVALTHSVDGAELRLACPGGERIVGTTRRSHLPPCEMRTVVMASAHPSRDCSRHVHALEVSGSLERTPRGVYRRAGRVGEAWFATFLRPGGISRIVSELPDDEERDAVVRVRPDGGLGVSCIAVTVEEQQRSEVAVDVAAMLLERCVATELVADLRRHSGRAR